MSKKEKDHKPDTTTQAARELNQILKGKDGWTGSGFDTDNILGRLG